MCVRNPLSMALGVNLHLDTVEAGKPETFLCAVAKNLPNFKRRFFSVTRNVDTN